MDGASAVVSETYYGTDGFDGEGFGSVFGEHGDHRIPNDVGVR